MAVFDNLKKVFGIKVVSDKQSNQQDFQMVDKINIKDAQTVKGVPSAKSLPPEIKKSWDWWVQNTHTEFKSMKRVERYRDLDSMVYNSGVVSLAANLYADETVQYDSGIQPLKILSKKSAITDYIYDFFEKIGINQNSLRAIAMDLTMYGDAFSINSFTQDKKGKTNITDFVPLDVYNVTDRLEFNALEVQANMKKSTKAWTNVVSKDSRLKDLAANINNKDDYGIYGKSYLFGYTIGEKTTLPPWAVTHFRLFSSHSEFYPFGRPMFIHSISPFKQLRASKNLMGIARMSKFPIKKFEIQTHEGMTEIDQFQKINEARMEYHNMTKNLNRKEDFPIDSEIWTAKGLLDFELVENRINLSDVADIEILLDEVIMGTKVPKGYLIVDRSSFGTSGVALTQQYKPFGRGVYQIQTAILQELIFLVRMQFLVSGDYPVDTEFELSMNFPVIEDTSDRLRAQSDSFRLAKDIISGIGEIVGLDRGEALPLDISQDILSKYTTLSPDDIEDWMKKIKATQPKEESCKRIREKLTEEMVDSQYIDSKKKLRMTEGTISQRHYITSQTTNEHQEMLLSVLKPKGGTSRSLKD